MFCNELPVGLLNVFKIFDSFMRFAKILVPLIIIVPTIIGFAKASMSSDAASLKKTAKLFPIRLVVGVSIFLLPNIVGMIFNVVDPNISNDGLECLLGIDDTTITNAKYTAVNKALKRANEELNAHNVNDVKDAIDALSDGDAAKTAYTSQYQTLKTNLDNQNKDTMKKRLDSIKANANKSSSNSGGKNITFGGNASQREIVNYALQWVGMKYVLGGACGRGQTMEWCKQHNTGTDCSGFAAAVYQHFGYDIGYAQTGSEVTHGKAVASLNEAQPGDLIFYSKGNLHHVAIYMGNNQIVEEQGRRAGLTANRTADHQSIYAIRRIIS